MNQTSSFNAILERARIDQTYQTVLTMRYLEYCTNSEKQLTKVLDCRASGHLVNDILQVKIPKFNEKFFQTITKP